jgi:hypothetical protein
LLLLLLLLLPWQCGCAVADAPSTFSYTLIATNSTSAPAANGFAP